MKPEDELAMETEFHAYVDDQLSPERRVAVEEYLARNPDTAARVMADLRSRDALRLARRSPAASRDNVRAARRLERTMARGRVVRNLPRVAAILIVGGLGWIANDTWGQFGAAHATPQPFFLDEAVMSHKTALMRAQLPSHPGRPIFNLAEIGAATHIVMPHVPESWKMVDVQLFPSDYGPSLQVTFDPGPGPLVSLFAIRVHTSAPHQPSVAHRGMKNVAFWQEGDIAYALTGRASATELDRVAEDMADDLTT